MRFNKAIGAVAALLLMFSIPDAGFGQNTNSGDIRGTVTDSTGAVVPGVTVTVLNVDNGITKDIVTNQDGLYDTGSILLGTYKITFAGQGFSQLVREGISLQVGLTTVNGVLRIGGATEQVVVNTDVPLLKTETGDQSTTLEAKTMAQLPNVGQDWENFAITLPGSSGLGVNGQGQVTSFNGNLPYNSMLADGATTTLSHSSNSDVSIFETVQEVQISTSSFSAQYGIGGAIFNQISKGGTNSWHGAAYEYFQNDALNAASYAFAKKARSGPNGAIGFQRYNNFGGSIGGPILKNKMFFYFNYDQIINHGGASTGYITVPTLAERAGDFSALTPILYDPATTVLIPDPNPDHKGQKIIQRTSFAAEYGNGNRIPAARIDKVAAAIQAYYPAPNVQVTPLGTGQEQNNYFFNTPNANPFKKYFGRFDYDISANNRLTMSDTQRDNPATYLNQNICPINCQHGDVDSNNAQVSDVWNLSSRTINEARMGFTSQLNFFTPYSIGQGYPAKVGLQFSKADVFPNINVDAIYGLAASTNAVYKEMVFDPSDVVTMIRGKHVLHFGGEFLFYRDDSTAWGNQNGGTMGYSGKFTRSTQGDTTSGLGYADFLLGQTTDYSVNISPEYGGRQKSPQVFVQDDWKVLPNLTVNLGLRYQIQNGWHEVKGNEVSFDPTIQNAKSNSLGAAWYGTTHANGRDSLQANVYTVILPRVGVSYQVHPNTVVRGGFGIYSYNWSLDTYGAGMGGALGTTSNISDQTNGITPVVILGSTGANLPYVVNSNSADPTAYNGQSFSYNQYHTPVPKIYQWNVGVQQELGTNMVANLSYVASHGFNLNFPVDINQVPESKLSANDSPSGRPYPQFQGLGGSTNNAISNYNSLQASIQKRLTSGISFDFNYTWSHFLDDQDSSGWGGRGGNQHYQNAYDPHANYGNSNFDVRNAFKGRVVWELPVGKGRRFLNNNFLIDAALGGWQASSTLDVQSGVPFTVLANNNANAQAGDQYPNQIGNPQLSNRSINHWFNEAAFAQPAAYTFGNVHRNSLTGPNLQNINGSLGKVFHIWEGTEMQIRADATNVINHPGFGTPNGNLTAGAAGAGGAFATGTSTIRGVAVGGRTIQLGARLSF